MVKTTHNNTDEHFCDSTLLMKEKPDKVKGKLELIFCEKTDISPF